MPSSHFCSPCRSASLWAGGLSWLPEVHSEIASWMRCPRRRSPAEPEKEQHEQGDAHEELAARVRRAIDLNAVASDTAADRECSPSPGTVTESEPSVLRRRRLATPPRQVPNVSPPDVKMAAQPSGISPAAAMSMAPEKIQALLVA